VIDSKEYGLEAGFYCSALYPGQCGGDGPYQYGPTASRPWPPARQRSAL